MKINYLRSSVLGGLGLAQKAENELILDFFAKLVAIATSDAVGVTAGFGSIVPPFPVFFFMNTSVVCLLVFLLNEKADISIFLLGMQS